MFGRAVHATVRDQPDVERTLRAALDTARIPVESLARIPPTLEHVFIARVQEAGGVVED